MDTPENSDYETNKRDRTLEELDRLAMDFIYDKEDEARMKRLHFEEHAYVMTMAHLYFLYRCGKVSKEKCINLKKKALHDYQRIHTQLYHLRIEHDIWVFTTKILSTDYTKLVDQIKSKDINLLNTALNIIDKLTRHNIYKKLYMAYKSGLTQQDIDAMINNCDKLPTKKDKHAAERIIYDFLYQINDAGGIYVFKSLSEDECEQILKRLPQERYTGEIPQEYIPK